MSILIKGMEMPTSCDDCKLRMAVGCCGNLPHNTRMPNCPLVEIPPHGRLIDADALTEAMESTDWYHQAPNKEMVHGANSAEHQAWYKEQDVYAKIDAAPTIIEAEEKK